MPYSYMRSKILSIHYDFEIYGYSSTIYQLKKLLKHTVDVSYILVRNCIKTFPFVRNFIKSPKSCHEFLMPWKIILLINKDKQQSKL